MKIPVVCHTNLDRFRTCKWPTEFCCPPQVGQYVASDTGASLRISTITHRIGKYPPNENAPYLYLELGGY